MSDWETISKVQSSNDGWETVTPQEKKGGPAVPFQSGTLFQATKDLIPDLDDVTDSIKKAWKKAKESTVDTKLSPERTKQLLDEEKATGWAVGDIVGGLPGMVAGAGHGVYSSLKNMDATQGLKEGMETMDKLMPSSLFGADEAKKNPYYHGTMAPVTAVMDTLNAVPILAGEGLNKAGYPNAAAQVTDAGKLAILGGMSVAGGKAAMKGMKGKAKGPSPAEILEALKKEPTLNEAPRPSMESTTAHADDFGAVNPYDVGGHVSRSEQGRPSVIDEAQGDFFGSEILEQSERAPDMGQASIRHDGIPYEKTSPLELDPTNGGYNKLGEISNDLNAWEKSAESGLELVPREGEAPAVPQERPIIEGNKPAEQAMFEQRQAEQQARIAADKDTAFTKAEQVREREYNLMEAQRELQLGDSLQNITERSTMRQAFLDRSNLDFQHARDVVGDKSLMSEGNTLAMREHLSKGDTTAALKAITDSHPNQIYRDLATYLSDKMDGLKVVMHDEPVLRHGERDVTGYYDPSTHTVGLSGRGATSPHTILHELTHAMTSHFLNTRPNDVRAMGLKSLYNMIEREKGMEKFPGIVNVKEFVAEAFSNPEFQTFLKDVRMNNRSVWQRFVDGVKSVFGIQRDTGISNAFEAAMDLGKQVVEAGADSKTILKEAGLSKKLADLMAQKPKDIRPVEVVENQSLRDGIKNIPALEHAVSDFAFYDKSPAEIVEMAKNAPDIPDTLMERFAQQAQAGALFEVLKTRNPVVKSTYERVTRAFQESAKMVKDKLTDPQFGLKKYMRDLTPTEKGTVWSVMMEHEGVRELTANELAAAGMNERQIAFYNKQRHLDNEFFDMINKQREAEGLAPMDRRMAHIAGRFLGDFSRMVTDAEGKTVGRIAGSTKWELERATKYMKEQHPDWSFNTAEYNPIGRGRNAGDRFAGFMEALNFIAKSDSNAKVLLDTYKGYLQKDAVNYLNATRHAKAKVKESGGIVGSEGNKFWKDAEKNAEEGMKAQLAYYEQGYQWMSMNKAVKEIKEVLGNEEVAKNHPNAVRYADKYVKHSMGREQGYVADALNTMISEFGNLTGIGHSNIIKANNNVKHLMMQKFMGFGNIPFTITQLLQPLQTQPALLRLLHNRGLEFTTSKGQLDAAHTYLKAEIEHSKLSPWEESQMKYAKDAGIFDVKMADHTSDINVSRFKETFDKAADFNIKAPEEFTRGMAFLFYSNILKEAGIPTRDIFSAAENMTNMTMVNYHPIERPMGFAKLGWIGDIASTLSRYKHNQWSQMAFYAREGVRGEHGIKSYAPLATMLGTSLAFGGVMGFFGFNEANAVYEQFSESVLKKPDSLTNQALKLPELISHGVFSKMGVDMTTRFSNANPIPDNAVQAIMPYGTAVWDMVAATGRLSLDPFNDFKQKQAIKAWAPQSTQGAMERMFMGEKETGGPNAGKRMYHNNTNNPNVGTSRVARTDHEQNWRDLGFRNITESKELQKAYSDSQIEKGRKNLSDKVLQKMKYDILGNKMTDAQMEKSLRRVAELGQDPNAVVGELVNWSTKRKLTQAQQRMVINAQRGYAGAFNIMESRK